MSAPGRIDVHHHILPAISSPGVHLGDAGAGRELARRCSDVSARLTSDGIGTYEGFDDAARAAIERENALALLPRMRERVGARTR